jgi:hypothetical protein
MKHKISISVDEQTLILINEGLLNGTFRNTSHAFEFAIKKLASIKEVKEK